MGGSKSKQSFLNLYNILFRIQMEVTIAFLHTKFFSVAVVAEEEASFPLIAGCSQRCSVKVAFCNVQLLALVSFAGLRLAIRVSGSRFQQLLLDCVLPGFLEV